VEAEPRRPQSLRCGVLGPVPHGPRTDHISQRDVEVLEFIARFGSVPRAAVATWARTSRTVTFTRERRLRIADLLTVRQETGAERERFVVATALGLRICGRRELRPARPSPATLHHELIAARLGAQLESRGERLRSEREIQASERAEGERIFSAELPGGRFHRPDLLQLVPGEPPRAIEVELSNKGAARLDGILRAWRFVVLEDRLSRVVYHCTPRTRRHVDAAIERTATAAQVEAVDLAL
jgi:hypothetical protein